MDGGEEVTPTHPGSPAAVNVVRGRLIQSMTTTAAGHRQSHRLSFLQAEADRRLEDCRRECEALSVYPRGQVVAEDYVGAMSRIHPYTART
jgi:hypothetical protein